MKILKQNLQNALTIVASGIAKKSSLSLLSCIRLVSDGQTLRLEATDLQKFVTTSIPLPDRGEVLDWAIDYTILSGLVNAIPAGEVEITSTENGIKIKAGAHKHNVRGADTDRWPRFDLQAPIVQADIEQAILKDGLDKVSFCASEDTSRAVLAGVYIGQANGYNTCLVATDGFRSSRFAHTALSPLSGKSLILPIASATELLRLLEDAGTINVALCDGRAIFKTDQFTFATQVVDGHYPDVTPMMDVPANVRCVCNVDDITQPARAASVFARMASQRSVDISIGVEGLRISSRAAEGGDSDVPVPLESVGGSIEFSCNVFYLLDALRACSGKIEISTNGKSMPIMIREVGNEYFKHVLMPTYSER